MESHDCQNVANLVTFVELSAETFDLDGRREVKSDNFVASRPIEDAEVHLKAVQLSKALLAKWLHCEFPAHKLLLTAPQPTGISELPGQRQVMNLRYESICNRRAIWYEGADLPLMSLKQETAGGDEVAKYWVSFVNERSLSKIVQNGRQKQVSGFSILSINYDDGRDRCGKGNYPLLNQLFELAERTPVTPKPTPQPTARPTPQPSVSDSTRLREICQVVTKHCQDL
ncbi:hypothetical protein HDE_03946 [Halotydeus destructor]|nr:hypothetical protein HDE_03946 [Halotydeus destructor]